MVYIYNLIPRFEYLMDLAVDVGEIVTMGAAPLAGVAVSPAIIRASFDPNQIKAWYCEDVIGPAI